jgi:phosphoglycerate dehydrogenase-like enzyme
VPRPRVAVGPKPDPSAATAIVAGGGELVDLGAGAEALVWLDAFDPGTLAAELAASPGIRWVQLPYAGIEHFAGLLGDGRLWTSAKGAYAEPVAEHAVALALAGLRHLPSRITARTWGEPAGATLLDAEVTILGGGGIASALLTLLAPFRCRATVVRRNPEPVRGAARTLPADRLHDALPGARVVFLTLALTPETTGIIGADELALMEATAWLVNVARGRHVVTADLVRALEEGVIAGAALDVTDPEPLPDGHPLWELPNAIITPHTADWPEIVDELLGRRITVNVRRFASGEPLEGMVDPEAGY